MHLPGLEKAFSVGKTAFCGNPSCISKAGSSLAGGRRVCWRGMHIESVLKNVYSVFLDRNVMYFGTCERLWLLTFPVMELVCFLVT